MKSSRTAETFLVSTQHEIVIIASAGQFQLPVRLIYARADGHRRGEIHRRALNRFDFARRNQSLIYRSKGVGIHLQLMIKNGSAPGEIEIGMVCQVDDGFLIRLRLIADLQLVAVGQNVLDDGRKVSRITFFAVFAEITKLNTVADLGRLPDDLVESFQPAVQMVGAIIGRQRIAAPVETESSARDAIGIPAD